MLDLRFGEYVDADPGNWLTWSGRGIYGRTRYACGEHRGDLKADLRETYGTVGRHPWAKGPHPWAGRRGTDRARRLARSLRLDLRVAQPLLLEQPGPVGEHDRLHAVAQAELLQDVGDVGLDRRPR